MKQIIYQKSIVVIRKNITFVKKKVGGYLKKGGRLPKKMKIVIPSYKNYIMKVKSILIGALLLVSSTIFAQ